MNIPRIELHFLPVNSCSIFRKTRPTPLLMWTWDANFYFVDMKRNTLKVYVQLCIQDVFPSAVGCMCEGVGIPITAQGRGGRRSDEITRRKTREEKDERKGMRRGRGRWEQG